MGKPKTKNRNRDLDDDNSDIDIVPADEEDTGTENKPAAKLSKKDKRRKKKDDDWEDDISSELATLSMEANKGNPDQNGIDDEFPAPVSKKEKKKKKKAGDDSDGEGDQVDMEVPTQKKKSQVASFQMLMVDSDDNQSEVVKDQSRRDLVSKHGVQSVNGEMGLRC